MTQRGSQRSVPRRRRRKRRRRRRKRRRKKRSNGATAQRCFAIRREKGRECTKQHEKGRVARLEGERANEA